MSWTPERTELLTRLRNEGYSASQIARRLGGVTRNAVIGKCNRLGLKHEERPEHVRRQKSNSTFNPPPPRKRCLTKSRAEAIWSWKDYERLEAEQKAGRISILELTSRTCRYPLGDEPPFEYCGKPTCARGSGVYCTGHAAICYSGIPRKSDKRFSLPGNEGKAGLGEAGRSKAWQGGAI